MGVGNILFTDEGFGIRVIEKIRKWYSFPDTVSVVDGGVLGLNLLGVIAGNDHLVAVDTICYGASPGTLHRLAGEQIPERIRAKNSLHQIDFLEALTLCQALDEKVPETVIVGVEPEDMTSFGLGLTPLVESKTDKVIAMVLAELDRLEVAYERRSEPYVPCDTFQNYEN